MPKRKYDEMRNPKAADRINYNHGSHAQLSRIEQLLEHGTKGLFRSLKVARGFERQKLGRRQKKAIGENAASDIARLDTEVAALKNIDLYATAKLYLYKSLLKIKPVASAPTLPQTLKPVIDATRQPQSPASANVQARLFKSTPVQTATVDALNSISGLLGISGADVKPRKRLRAKDFEERDEKEATSTLKVVDVSKTLYGSPPTDEGREALDVTSKLENIQNNHGSQDSDVNDNVDYDMYASRLASSPHNDSTGEQSQAEKPDRKYTSHGGQHLESESDIDASDNSIKERKAEPNPKTSTTSRIRDPPSSAPTKSTTFLPSLSLAGYYSGGSSASSIDDDDDQRPQQRRNRMGQQARRALWEKKYGTRARHVRNQKQKLDRDKGWDARRGATGARRKGVGRGPKSSGANSDPVGVRKVKGKADAMKEGPLHPSWEAAKKAKESKKAVAFEGKKVVF